jgi:hypothetical protein
MDRRDHRVRRGGEETLDQVRTWTGFDIRDLGAFCECWGQLSAVTSRRAAFCLDVAHMLPTDANDYLDEYEQDVDEIVAACNSDLRSALKALVLLNEQLEHKLHRVTSELTEHLAQGHQWQKLLH